MHFIDILGYSDGGPAIQFRGHLREVLRHYVSVSQVTASYGDVSIECRFRKVIASYGNVSIECRFRKVIASYGDVSIECRFRKVIASYGDVSIECRFRKMPLVKRTRVLQEQRLALVVADASEH
jgi:activator of HSP90 ATPase